MTRILLAAISKMHYNVILSEAKNLVFYFENNSEIPRRGVYPATVGAPRNENNLGFLRWHTVLFSVAIFGAMVGCSDMGSNPAKPAGPTPHITSVQPDSAFVGDTLKITGTDFGASKGSSTVTVGGKNADTIYVWSATEIRLKIPATAMTGNVTVTVGGTASNAVTFKVRGIIVADVSFANDVSPVFANSGCTSCHGGTNNLRLDTYVRLMLGTSVNGPVVTPGNGEGSVIIKKLRGTATFGDRMPQGGPFLANSVIDKISLWITQGAKNN